MVKINIITVENCAKPCAPNAIIKNCLTTRQKEILFSSDKFGIPIWARGTDYTAGSIVSDYKNGVLTFYQAVKSNKGNNPQTDNGDNWLPIDIGGGSGGDGDNRWRASSINSDYSDGKTQTIIFQRGNGTTISASTPFKTINGDSVFGVGNIDVSGIKGDKGDKGDPGEAGKDGAAVKSMEAEVSEDGSSFVLKSTLTDGEEIATGTIPLPSGGEGGVGGTVEIVETETLPAGQPAKTEETSDSTAQARKYVLSVPQGPQGEQGEQGLQGDKGDPGEAGKDGAAVKSMEAEVSEDGSSFVLKSTLTDGEEIATGTIPLPSGGEGGAATVSYNDLLVNDGLLTSIITLSDDKEIRSGSVDLNAYKLRDVNLTLIDDTKLSVTVAADAGVVTSNTITLPSAGGGSGPGFFDYYMRNDGLAHSLTFSINGGTLKFYRNAGINTDISVSKTGNVFGFFVTSAAASVITSTAFVTQTICEITVILTPTGSISDTPLSLTFHYTNTKTTTHMRVRVSNPIGALPIPVVG